MRNLVLIALFSTLSYGFETGDLAQGHHDIVHLAKKRQTELGDQWSPQAYGDSTSQPGRYYLPSGPNPNMVFDSLTGLIWQRAQSQAPVTWNVSAGSGSAQGYCDSLSIGGHSDWRIPSVKELQSLVDYTVLWPPMLNKAAFSQALSAMYWTSEIEFSHQRDAWEFSFKTANLGLNPLATSAPYVRCVRGAQYPIANRYTDERGQVLTAASSQVFDRKTAFVWQRFTAPNKMIWADSLEYCSGLNLGGQVWRMPTIKELVTIVDFQAANASVDATIFPGTLSEEYWSSTRGTIGSKTRLGVDFHDGNTSAVLKNSSLLVRCVRYQKECSEDLDCSGNASICMNGACVQCEQDSDCMGMTPYCSRGICVECVSNSECGMSTPYCVNSACVECWEGIPGRQCWNMSGHVGCCPVNTFCSSPSVKERRCVECRSTTDCKRNSRPFCNSASSACTASCEADKDCGEVYLADSQCKSGKCWGAFLGEEECND
ncbi:MAG: DUF1566 domain-containing protein [Myxococcaceae bacterium]|nr:DUF1566 domain-containing protein [Myxococcaceae bacterium]MBH2005866.1 DUF1566 domain-containing protein [Myxococcaceae bacterium]